MRWEKGAAVTLNPEGPAEDLLPGSGSTWREALSSVRERRELWPASLLLAVGLSDTWRVLFGWGPEWVGERAAEWVRGGGGKGAADALVLVGAAVLSFVAQRAVGYLGETVLVRQVYELARRPGKADMRRGVGLHKEFFSPGGKGTAPEGGPREGGLPGAAPASSPPDTGRGGSDAGADPDAPPRKGPARDRIRGPLAGARGTYPALFAVLLPWDAMRLLLVTLPSLLVLAWGRWDPRLRLVLPYLFLLVTWAVSLALAHFYLGVTAALAARYAVTRGKRSVEAWREGWRLLRRELPACLTAWLQAMAASLCFLATAWVLSLLLPWLAVAAADGFPVPPVGRFLAIACWLALVFFLVLGQTLVSGFVSALWTLTFRRLVEK